MVIEFITTVYLPILGASVLTLLLALLLWTGYKG